MTEIELDLTEVKDYMVGYSIVSKIYEIRDENIFADIVINYTDLIMNINLINLIDELNFVYVKDVGILDKIKEIQKIGNLLNFSVYLDPNHPNDIITMLNKDGQKVEIKILF